VLGVTDRTAQYHGRILDRIGSSYRDASLAEPGVRLPKNQKRNGHYIANDHYRFSKYLMPNTTPLSIIAIGR
jgi:hypothetical protein